MVLKYLIDNLKRKSGIIGQPRKEPGSSDNTLTNPLRKSESIDSMKEAQYGYPTPTDVRERYVYPLSILTYSIYALRDKIFVI